MAEKIVGVGYHSASNFRTHRDKCFVGWNRAILTIQQNRTHFFLPTFWAEQETFYCPTLYFLSFVDKLTFVKTFHAPAPEKIFFLVLRPRKRHIGWKNNSKQLLRRCCYTNFRLFARKSQLCTRIVGRKIVICGQTNKNEYSSASAKIAFNRFSNLHVFFQVSNPKKVFSRGPVCHWRHYLILSSW